MMREQQFKEWDDKKKQDKEKDLLDEEERRRKALEDEEERNRKIISDNEAKKKKTWRLKWEYEQDPETEQLYPEIYIYSQRIDLGELPKKQEK